MKHLVGTYGTGFGGFSLYLDSEEEGGNFMVYATKMPEIIVGYQDRILRDVKQTLLHEILEVIMTQMGLSYVKYGDWENFTGSRHFHFNHAEFTELCCRAGCFLARCEDDLVKTYNRLTKCPKSKSPKKSNKKSSSSAKRASSGKKSPKN